MASDGQRFPAIGSSGQQSREDDYGSQGPVQRGSDGHYDVTSLADLDAAVLSAPDTDTVRAHVAECAHCDAVLDELRSLRTELATLPPPKLPDSVAARISAALDGEREARFGAATAELPVLGRDNRDNNVTSLTSARRRIPRWLNLVAAAVVLVGGGGTVLAVQASLGDTDTSAHSVASTTDDAGGPASLFPHPDAVPDKGTAANLPTYTRGNILDHLTSILAQSACADSNGNPPKGHTGGCAGTSAGGMADQARRAKCTSSLRQMAGLDGDPTAVQAVLFEGAPAFVFVFDGTKVVVVSDTCGVSDQAHVLFSGH